MSNKDNGGPAFPTENARQTGPSSWHEEGMTLRDYFAAKAMQGFAASESEESGHWTDETVAERAYAWADAMLEARKQ